MSSFDYINRTYGLSLKRGSRVEYVGDTKGGPEQGSVTSAAGGYLYIRFDGETKVVGPFHPTWGLRHIDAALSKSQDTAP